jgi:hypothetical protein
MPVPTTPEEAERMLTPLDLVETRRAEPAKSVQHAGIHPWRPPKR